MTGEKCARCGEVDQDRRTLWMACFYSMEELHVPFEKIAISGQVVTVVGEKRMKGFEDFPVPVFSEPDKDKPPDLYQLYTLRVCKGCRADWMGAIKGWYESVPDHFLTDDPDKNIPVRVGGRTVMMNREEFEQYRESKETT